MSKTEISAKILKSKKNISFIIIITQKLISTYPGWGYSFEPNMKQIHETVEALESEIGFFAAIWDFVEEAKNASKNYRASSLGPILLPNFDDRQNEQN